MACVLVNRLRADVRRLDALRNGPQKRGFNASASCLFLGHFASLISEKCVKIQCNELWVRRSKNTVFHFILTPDAACRTDSVVVACVGNGRIPGNGSKVRLGSPDDEPPFFFETIVSPTAP